MLNRTQVQQALDAGGGLLRLEPSWVPRSFMVPGRRLKLHPDDVYALGGHRGGINERWFSSTTNADNGPGTPKDEGLSYVRIADGKRFLLKEAVEKAGDLLLGADVMEREKGWNLLCKFFDNLGAIPHHMHQSDEQAKLLGRKGKPEAYYFPPQYNETFNNFPYTFMGLEPGTTKADVRKCLENWNRGDNGITFGRIVPWDLLVKDVLPEHHKDLDYIVDMLDWDANTNPNFGADNKRFPKPVAGSGSPGDTGYQELWVCYGTTWYSAKELTVQPKRTVTIKDSAAYGIIVTQGYGRFGKLPVSTPSMIRFGQMTEDELFVSAAAAAEGVTIENLSESDPLVILKHFGPGNPDAKGLVTKKK